MGHRTGTFFQMARGRAMVRTRAMREARQCQRAIADLLSGRSDSPARRILGGVRVATMSTDDLVALLHGRMSYHAGRARRANRDWREYRRTSIELQEGE